MISLLIEADNINRIRGAYKFMLPQVLRQYRTTVLTMQFIIIEKQLFKVNGMKANEEVNKT